MNRLKDAGTEIFSFTPRSEQPLRFVIKRLPEDLEEDFVRENLVEKGYTGVQMHIFTICSLVVGFLPAACALNSSFCEMFMTIGSCEKISGPAVSCSQQLYDHATVVNQMILQSFQQLSATYNDSVYKDSKRRSFQFYKYKSAVDNLIYFVRETVAKQQNISNKVCIGLHQLEMITESLSMSISGVVAIVDWMDIIFPILGGIIFIFGMMGNLLIMMIYFWHQDMNSGANKVIVNLALGDILLLIFYIPVFYSTLRWMTPETYLIAEWILGYMRTVSIGVSIYSMTLLSILRYLATTCTPGSRAAWFLNKHVLMLVAVWVLALITALILTILRVTNSKGLTRMYLWFVGLCILPLIVIAVFNFTTSRILHRSIPGVQTLAMLHESRCRQRGAKVILSLVVIFCVTHHPLYILTFSGYLHSVHYSFLFSLLTTLNSCLNPVGLFISSRQFQKHLKTYFAKVNCNDSENGK